RVEREPLVLRELQADRLHLTQPGRATQLAAAPPDPAEQRGLVPHPDLLQLDPGPEGAREVTHELPKIHAALRREVDEQLVAVELPLRIAHLHLQPVLLHLLPRDAP